MTNPAADSPLTNSTAADLAHRLSAGEVTAAEVAAAVAFLASPESGSTTGTALAVDGGMQGLRLRPRG